MQQKRKRKYIIIGSIIGFLIMFRILLPAFILKYANRSLAGMPGYYGQVADIDLNLYRGAYQLDSIYINKVDASGDRQTEFFHARKIDLSIEWGALIQGAIVGELEFFDPTLIFTREKTELEQVVRDTNDFRKILKDFMPLRVNRFEVHRGNVHYVDRTSTPKVDIFLREAYILARNLKNTHDSRELLPADVRVEAEAYEGILFLFMRLNALAEEPTFDLNASIRGANLSRLNDFFKAYGKFDVSRGTLGFYTEFAAEGGKFKGYVKPVIKNLKVVGLEDQENTFIQKAKETLIAAAGKLLTNPREEQLATKVPIEGSFEDSDAAILEAVWMVLKNAFIEALMPAVDNEINMQSIEEVSWGDKKDFFKQIFGRGKKDKEAGEEGLRRYQ